MEKAAYCLNSQLLFSQKELCLQVKQSVASKVSSEQANSI